MRSCWRYAWGAMKRFIVIRPYAVKGSRRAKDLYMRRYPGLFVGLILLTAAALAQTVTEEAERSSSPVAYVYVSRTLHIDGFAAASDGRLTRVPGSPFLNPNDYGHVTSMVVNKKYLFGGPVYTYSIAADGALKPISEINSTNYPDDCGAGGLQALQIDYTGTTVYSEACQSFKIEENGALQFLGAADRGVPDAPDDLSQLVILGTNKYAYQTGCVDATSNPITLVYQRESNGLLTLIDHSSVAPKTGNPDDIYCAFYLAGDPANHLVSVNREYDKVSNQFVGPWVLATYTADAHGNLSTTSSYENMPASPVPNTVSISPTGKLLAVGGDGFQVFHLNAGDPITPYTGLIQANHGFGQFAWDNSNHLYALATGYDGADLFVYTVTPTSIVQAPGSPYPVPDGGSIVVRSLK
jgi:hypothetical protein